MFFLISTNTSWLSSVSCIARKGGLMLGQKYCPVNVDMHLCAVVCKEVPNHCQFHLFLPAFSLFFLFPSVVLLTKCHMGWCCSRKFYLYCMLLSSHSVCTFSFQSWVQVHPRPAVLELFLLQVNETICC